jgi:hypothetical protein
MAHSPECAADIVREEILQQLAAALVRRVPEDEEDEENEEKQGKDDEEDEGEEDEGEGYSE